MSIDSAYLTFFVRSFAKKELTADTLFNKVEEEILRHGADNLERHGVVQILWAFSEAKKGGRQLFDIMDNELDSRGVEGFNNSDLLQIALFFDMIPRSLTVMLQRVFREFFRTG